jgi:hypothetical protein
VRSLRTHALGQSHQRNLPIRQFRSSGSDCLAGGGWRFERGHDAFTAGLPKKGVKKYYGDSSPCKEILDPRRNELIDPAPITAGRVSGLLFADA